MPRIRTIKPELWESEKLGRLSVLARLSFVGLISLADDEGRGRGDPAFLFARLHAYAPDVGPKDMRKALDEIAGVGLAAFYQAAGCSYYAIPTWADNQKIDKPSTSKLPAPSTGVKAFGEDSANVRGTLGEDSPLDQGPGTKDQVSRTREQGPGPQADFEHFWASYPKKQARQDALKAWGKLKPGADLQPLMLAALEAQKRSPDWLRDGGKFIPHPASWLNGRRWEDEAAVAVAPRGGEYAAL